MNSVRTNKICMMEKKMRIILTILAVFFFSKGNKAVAQSTDPQKVMADIYTAYNNVTDLTFDVKYIYTSDTLNGKFLNESLNGSYRMVGNKALYELGAIQYMQNDSFLIAVYNDEKFILISNPRTQNNIGSNLPLRSLLDSVLHSYGEHYTISTTKVSDTTSALNFIRKDSLAQFDKFSVTYYTKGRALLSSIAYDFKEATYTEAPDSVATQLGNRAPLPIIYRRKTLALNFFNYRYNKVPEKLFNESNYIRLENGKWVTADKYKDFQIYNYRTNDGPVNAGQHTK